MCFYYSYILKEQLATNIKSNQVQELLDKGLTVRSYDKYTDEEYQHAINLAEQYIAIQPDYKNPNTVAFNLLKQNKLIGGNATFKQIFLLFVLIYDPELKAYQIYLDESTKKSCKKRMKEELGFYSEELIRLEKLYHKRFTPDKKDESNRFIFILFYKDSCTVTHVNYTDILGQDFVLVV